MAYVLPVAAVAAVTMVLLQAVLVAEVQVEFNPMAKVVQTALEAAVVEPQTKLAKAHLLRLVVMADFTELEAVALEQILT